LEGFHVELLLLMEKFHVEEDQISTHQCNEQVEPIEWRVEHTEDVVEITTVRCRKEDLTNDVWEKECDEQIDSWSPIQYQTWLSSLLIITQ